MEIPHDSLEPDTLTSLIREFVLREGTDYGSQDYSIEDKIAQVKRQLDRKEVFIVFDPEEQSFNIVPKNRS